MNTVSEWFYTTVMKAPTTNPFLEYIWMPLSRSSKTIELILPISGAYEESSIYFEVILWREYRKYCLNWVHWKPAVIFESSLPAYVLRTFFSNWLLEKVFFDSGQVMEKVFLPIDGTHIELERSMVHRRISNTFNGSDFIWVNRCRSILPSIRISHLVSHLYMIFWVWFQ